MKAVLFSGCRAGLLMILTGAVLIVSSLHADQPVKEHADLVADYDQDLAAFKRLRGSLSGLAVQVRARTDLFGPRPAEDLTLLRPDIRRQIYDLWYPILENYLALDTLADKHMAFFRLKEKRDSERSFHLARGVFLTEYRMALDLIAVFEQNPMMDTILNEADNTLGLPHGVYAHFKYQYLNLIKASNYAALEAVALGYGPAADKTLAHWADEDNRTILAAGKGPGPVMTFKNGLAIIKRVGGNAWFPVQKGVAGWMGRTKVWRPHQYLIRPGQIRALEKQLQPGDILLERREWYMTNVGIPGFWTHAALYIGSSDQRQAVSKHPQVAAWLEKQQAGSIDLLIKKRYPRAYASMTRPYKDGHLPQVIEAIAGGVTLTSIDYSAGCDSLAVLRPRLPVADRVAAVVRAMNYYDRPYDYDFDFGSDDRLVCTELIVKSYLAGPQKKGLQLPLAQVMGHLVTPANAFVQQFDATFGKDAQQLDLILFLDGNEQAGRAFETGATVFRDSWQRPKWHILLPSAAVNPE